MKRVTLLRTRIFTALAVIGSLAGAQAGSFFADFNDGLVPANATVYGNANVQGSGGYILNAVEIMTFLLTPLGLDVRGMSRDLPLFYRH
jgi:hypothetical protein